MKTKQNQQMTINSTEVMLNSANKLGRHLDHVKTGCGAHVSKRDYTRKVKHKNKQFDKYRGIA